LRRDDFVLAKINWKDKADNIRELADEIGVGLSSICVIDDSPYEREAIRRMLPGVIVPELPDDLTQWPAFLLDHPYLGSLRLTKEDHERAHRYRVRAHIQKEAAGFSDKEDFWRSLGMNLHFHVLSDANQQRVLQLLSKTNQFNTTTRRYGEADLIRIRQEGGVAIPVGLSDKYCEREIVGVLVLLPSGEQATALAIDSFLLSCRVLGRNVETGILGWICRYAKDRGYRFLEGWFSATDRNQPASGVYRDAGFTDAGAGRWLLDLGSAAVAVPEWFAVTDELKQ
jgi:FkbH-like protein